MSKMKVLALVMALFLIGIFLCICAGGEVFSGICAGCVVSALAIDIGVFFFGVFLIAMGLGILQVKYQIFE